MLGASSTVYVIHPLTHSFLVTTTRGLTQTPNATSHSLLPSLFSGATCACSSDALCVERAHAVEVHTLVGYPVLVPKGWSILA